jgi:hypothetical protein
LNPEDGTDKLSQNAGKNNYHFSLRNDPEERSSLPVTLYVVKSRNFIRCLMAKNLELLRKNQNYQISKFNITAKREKTLNQLKKKKDQYGRIK